MPRAVVFKTKGKLDLRSLTVFGMNAKPTTTTPIGYFGTGLKYAMAVLAREKIPVSIWIDGKKWTIEQDETKFRDKEFSALSLKTMRGKMLPPKYLPLPFTTELGKNWDLWQAFRELESNTRDEKGETRIGHSEESTLPHDMRGHTYIIVESEDFVQEFYDRDKTFLPEGLTLRGSSERIQCFAQKSNYIYYRGIRIIDLKEPSENTYNLLCPVELTEDRTAKSQYAIEWEIERFIAETSEEEIVERALTAPVKSYERKLTYAYATRSDLFMGIIAQNQTSVNPTVLDTWKAAQPKKVIHHADWRKALIGSLEQLDYTNALTIVREYKDKLLRLLEKDIEDWPIDVITRVEAEEERTSNVNEDIPF